MSFFATSHKSAKSFAPTPQQRQAGAPEQSVWVSANAGSGKTHVLVERIIRLLLAGAEPATILSITYTKAAAAEMAGRLFERLAAWTAMSDAALTDALDQLGAEGHNPATRLRARRLFTMALETPGGLKIQTIHAFCERLLHLFPVEAGMAPGFRVMDEATARDLRQQASAQVLRAAELASEGPEAKAFATLSNRVNSEQFDALIKIFVESLARLGNAATILRPEAYATLLKLHLGLAPQVSAADVTRQLAEIDRIAYARHAEALKPYKLFNRRDLAALLGEAGKAEDPTAYLLNFYLTEKREPRKQLLSKAMQEEQPETAAFLAAEQTRIAQLVIQCNSLETIASSADAYALARAILAAAEQQKRRLGLYDFADLISRAAQLLSTRRATQWVLYKLDKGLEHILVDEAQDTSPDQWRIVKALAEEFFAGDGPARQRPRTLFVVGDQKQSIYSFQGADALAFFATRAELTARQDTAPGLTAVELTISYRSAQGILDAVDKVFPPDHLHRLGIPEAAERGHQAARLKADGVVELWPLEATEDDEAQDNPWSAPVDRPPQFSPRRKLARKLAQTIADWLNPAQPRQLASTGRAVRPDDILILFQSRGPLYRMVLAALRQMNVPVAGADRLDLLQSLIVQDLLVLLGWLLLPQDDHALAVLLKSPLVPEPLNEEALFNLCHDRAGTPLFARLTGANADYLQGLRAKAQQLSPFALLSAILTTARPAIAARLGPEALEASDAMLDMALDHQRQHGISLFGFVRWFARTETVLRREMDKGQGAVRLLTVHGAKGLESPIVILPDTSSVPSGGQAGPKVLSVPAGLAGAGLPLWLPSGAEPFSEVIADWVAAERQRSVEERNRLLYVAMTRAADELYVTGTAPSRGKLPENCWWNTITQALGAPGGDAPLRVAGGPDQTANAPASGQAAAPVITPAWLHRAPPPEAATPLANAATSLAHPDSAYGAAASRRGRMLHKLLDALSDAAPQDRLTLAQKRGARLGLAPEACAPLAAALNQPELAPFLGPQSQGEVEIAGTLADGTEMTGRLDRLAIRPEGLWLLDFKTDRFVPESLQDHPYAAQMAAYVALLRRAYPGRPITAALFWTQTQHLQILPEGLLTAALHKREPQVS